MTNIAIVTGASSGLGQEFVKQLNHKMIDEIWVIARRKDNLLALQKISHKKVIAIPMDLTLDTSIVRLEHILKVNHPHISYLINAAGMGKLGSFQKMSFSDIKNMMALNMNALVGLTKICLPYMHGNDHIIQIGSASAFQPLPYLNVYSATKAFVYHFSLALHEELLEQGIKVTCVNPYWISDTEFISIAEKENHIIKSYPFASTKQKVVQNAFRDNEHNKPLCTPDWVSRLDAIVNAFIPKSVMMKIWKGSLNI